MTRRSEDRIAAEVARLLRPVLEDLGHRLDNIERRVDTLEARTPQVRWSE